MPGRVEYSQKAGSGIKFDSLFSFACLVLLCFCFIDSGDACATQLHNNFCDSQADGEWTEWNEWSVMKEGCLCPYGIYERQHGRIRERETTSSLACPRRFNKQSQQTEEWPRKCNSSETICINPECGISDAHLTPKYQKVVGGRPMDYGSIPYQAQLRYKGKFTCGGVLISDLTVLTAAHCLEYLDKHEMTVVLGADRSSGWGANAVHLDVSDWMIHPEYDFPFNDIALILLENSASKVTYKAGVAWPACLPDTTLNLDEETALLTGWGETQPYRPDNVPADLPGVTVLDYPYSLQGVWLPLMSNEECFERMLNSSYADETVQEIFNVNGTVQDFADQICGGRVEGRISACFGDSGGPLVIFDNAGRATVVGIVSWGYACGFSNFASVFSRVDFHLEWIHSAMQQLRFPWFIDHGGDDGGDDQGDDPGPKPTPGPSPVPEPEFPPLPPLPYKEYPPCGLSRGWMPTSRIIGGASVGYGDLPYQVLILNYGSQHCGGTLIAPRFVISAAHCFIDKDEKYDLNEMSFVLAADLSNGTGDDAVFLKAVSVKYHRNYPLSQQDDVAVIFLEEAAENATYKTDRIWPACLPDTTEIQEKRAMASGWGSTQPKDTSQEPTTIPGVTVLSGDYPLQKVSLPLIDHTDCTKMIGEQIREQEICAGVEEGGKDSCQGDSGGPLVVFRADPSSETNMTATVIGVTSWGLGCGYPGYPGVYASVGHYLDWIERAKRSLFYGQYPELLPDNYTIGPVPTNVTQPPERNRTEKCGNHEASSDELLKQTKVIGGSSAPYGSLPYQVLIVDGVMCGGTLIGDRVVLTAAHCFAEMNINSTRFILASNTSEGDGPDAVSVSAIGWKNHESYNSDMMANDIAIAVLDEVIVDSVYTNPKIWPACLPPGKMNLTSGEMSLVSGWGSTQPVNVDNAPVTLPNVTVLEYPFDLQQVWLPLSTHDDCSRIMTDSGKVGAVSLSSSQICAGFMEGGKDGCQGDSGGPLVVMDENDAATVVGVTSFGFGCGMAELFGVYARVDSYLEWIDDSIAELMGK